MIQESLVTLLSPLAAVYPSVASQSDSSDGFIVYQRVASNTENILDGNGTPPINNTRMQIDAYSKTYSGAQTLAQSIRVAMLGWSIQNVELMELDGYDSEVRRHHVTMDYSIWH